jgi:hypothetical protein
MGRHVTKPQRRWSYIAERIEHHQVHADKEYTDKEKDNLP